MWIKDPLAERGTSLQLLWGGFKDTTYVSWYLRIRKQTGYRRLGINNWQIFISSISYCMDTWSHGGTLKPRKVIPNSREKEANYFDIVSLCKQWRTITGSHAESMRLDSQLDKLSVMNWDVAAVSTWANAEVKDERDSKLHSCSNISELFIHYYEIAELFYQQMDTYQASVCWSATLRIFFCCWRYVALLFN